MKPSRGLVHLKSHTSITKALVRGKGSHEIEQIQTYMVRPERADKEVTPLFRGTVDWREALFGLLRSVCGEKGADPGGAQEFGRPWSTLEGPHASRLQAGRSFSSMPYHTVCVSLRTPHASRTL
ncbi:hypothetical protein MTO96_003098 [Rhipicephalus appendiculatus]